MSNQSTANHEGTTGSTSHLSPEELAVLDSAGTTWLRDIFTAIWRVKLRLQFTGWLQYMPSAIIALGFLLIAALANSLGGRQVATALAAVGVLLLAVFAFDLLTVKFRIRFREALPKPYTDLDTFDLMRARHSCRSFQTRKLTPSDRSELMEHVHRRSEELKIGRAPVRFEYVSAPLTVWPTVNATEFLVAIAPKQYSRLAVIDVGRSLQKIVLDATRMGLGTCWIGPGANQSSVAHHLGQRFDPEEDHIICVCAVGYKSSYIPLFLRIFNLQFRRRLPLSSLFFANSDLKEPLKVDSDPYCRFGRVFEVCQWSPSSYNGQTTRCVAVMTAGGSTGADRGRSRPRLARFDFYATTESRYYAAVAVGIWCADWETGCGALGIKGHFAILSAEQRGAVSDEAQAHPARYDVSWVLDDEL